MRSDLETFICHKVDLLRTVMTHLKIVAHIKELAKDIIFKIVGKII